MSKTRQPLPDPDASALRGEAQEATERVPDQRGPGQGGENWPTGYGVGHTVEDPLKMRPFFNLAT